MRMWPEEEVGRITTHLGRSGKPTPRHTQSAAAPHSPYTPPRQARHGDGIAISTPTLIVRARSPSTPSLSSSGHPPTLFVLRRGGGGRFIKSYFVTVSTRSPPTMATDDGGLLAKLKLVLLKSQGAAMKRLSAKRAAVTADVATATSHLDKKQREATAADKALAEAVLDLAAKRAVLDDVNAKFDETYADVNVSIHSHPSHPPLNRLTIHTQAELAEIVNDATDMVTPTKGAKEEDSELDSDAESALPEAQEDTELTAFAPKVPTSGG